MPTVNFQYTRFLQKHRAYSLLLDSFSLPTIIILNTEGHKFSYATSMQEPFKSSRQGMQRCVVLFTNIADTRVTSRKRYTELQVSQL